MSDIVVDRMGRVIATAFASRMGSRVNDEMVQNAYNIGSQFFSTLLDPRRDVNKECHYPETSDISPQDYKALFDRDPIANRVVSCICKESWQVQPKVYEAEDPDVTTPFEEAWDSIQPMTSGASWFRQESGGSVWDYLLRADILSGIGHFGVLLMGFDDGKNLQEPVDGAVTTNIFREQPRISDCYLTEKEESILRSLPDLSEQEVFTLNQLAEQRRIVVNYMRDQQERKNGNGRPSLFGDSTGELQTGEGLDGTDKQYSQGFGMRGEADYLPSAAGTEQQYFGVQFGPTQIPSKQTSPRQTRLLFLRPFDESLVQVVRYEWNINNPRFGMPVMYRITLNDPREQHSGIGLPMATVFVHWSRVIHLADNLNSSEIFGAPRIRPVLNRILDLQKIYGASGEGYWQAAFTGIALSTHPQLGGDVEIDMDDLRNQMENYVNSFQRYLAMAGMSATTIAPSVSDPTGHINAHIEAICIQLGMPMRILKGSERGELASSQDDASWNDRLRARQLGYITPRIICPFVDRLIQVGVLPEPSYVEPEEPEMDEFGNFPWEDDYGNEEEALSNPWQGEEIPEGQLKIKKNKLAKLERMWKGTQNVRRFPMLLRPKRGGRIYRATYNAELGAVETEQVGTKSPIGYSVWWPDLDSNTDIGKAQIAATKTQALATYVSGNVESVMPLMEFYTKILGMDDEEAKPLVKAAEAQQAEMQQQQMEQQMMGGGGPEEQPGMEGGDDQFDGSLDGAEDEGQPPVDEGIGEEDKPWM